MKFKVLSCFFCATLILSVPVKAQEQDDNVRKLQATMTKELNLTEAQVQLIKPILTEYVTQSRKVMQDAQTWAIVDHKALSKQLWLIREDENQKLALVLTPDQLHQWIHKENMRTVLNQDTGDSQAQDGVALTDDGVGVNMRF